MRLATGVASILYLSVFRRVPLLRGGDGVLIGADETAVVADEVEGTLSFAGVEKFEFREPKEISCNVPVDEEDRSALALSAADITMG